MVRTNRVTCRTIQMPNAASAAVLTRPTTSQTTSQVDTQTMVQAPTRSGTAARRQELLDVPVVLEQEMELEDVVDREGRAR